MSDVDLLRSLQQDEYVLNIAAASMYQIREPKGSKKVSFENLSLAKRARNRELAIHTLTAVFERYPDPSKVSSVTEVKVFLAEQMYKTLAPNKSESFPFDQRTPFARSYYQERAETFLHNFLLPFAEQQPHLSAPTTHHAPNHPPRISGTSPSTSSAFREVPQPKPVPPTQQPGKVTSGQSKSEQIHTRQSSDYEPNAIETTGGSRHHTLTAGVSASAPHKARTPSTPPAQSHSSPATAFGCLLLVVIVLLLILIVRTF